MKKKFIIPMIAVAAISGAVLFSAFKVDPLKSEVSTLQFWQYSGTGLQTDENQYSLASGAACAGGENVVCTIRAEENPNNPGHPMIDSGLESRINAKNEAQGDVFVRD